MTTNTMPSRIEVWAQVLLTACLLIVLSVLLMTPGFISLRPDSGAQHIPAAQQETR
ncbi:MAG: hypothetical protein NVSMB42_06360 [Herpetosiphon sp.]